MSPFSSAKEEGAPKNGGGFFARLPALSLLSEIQSCQDGTIPLDVLLLQVVEKAPALTDHLEKAATAVMVVLVVGKVLVEVVDPLGKQRDLHLGGTGITLVEGMLGDDFLFGLGYISSFYFRPAN